MPLMQDPLWSSVLKPEDDDSQLDALHDFAFQHSTQRQDSNGGRHGIPLCHAMEENPSNPEHFELSKLAAVPYDTW